MAHSFAARCYRYGPSGVIEDKSDRRVSLKYDPYRQEVWLEVWDAMDERNIMDIRMEEALWKELLLLPRGPAIGYPWTSPVAMNEIRAVLEKEANGVDVKEADVHKDQTGTLIELRLDVAPGEDGPFLDLVRHIDPKDPVMAVPVDVDGIKGVFLTYKDVTSDDWTEVDRCSGS